MIRSIAVSLWIISVTLAAAYLGLAMQTAKSTSGSEQAEKPAAIQLKTITVPVIASGALQGYVLTEISIAAKPDMLKSLPQPPNLLLGDEIFRTLYAEEQIDFKFIEKTDLARLSAKIRDNINSRAGVAVAEQVFIQELHYMSKEDASSDGKVRRQ